MLILPDWLRYSLEWSMIGLPFGIYLLQLGVRQYRLIHPVLVSGKRDLLELLLGLSGFFLLGPPTWILHRLRWLGEGWYWAGYCSYALALLILARQVLKRQRHTTVIYAVDPADAQDALQETIKKLESPSVTVLGRIYWPQQQAVLDVTLSPWLQTATLRWLEGDKDWRQAVEATLQSALLGKEARRRLVPGLLTLGTVLVGLGVLHLSIWLLILWLRP